MNYFLKKIAVVTGAGSGIGRALAIQLAEHGCHLAISDINEESLAETVELLPGREHLEVTAHRLDVSDRQAFTKYAKDTIDHFDKVDIVINNAGLVTDEMALDEYDYERYERVINVNLWGVIHGTHEFLPHLLANPGSHLVNISSIFGLIALPGVGVYNLTKFAVRGYTETLRSDLESRHVHVSCVHPGLIATNIAVAAGASDDIVKLFSERGMAPEKAAKKILKGVEKGKARILVTGGAYVVDAIQRLLPSSYRSLVMPIMGIDTGDAKKN